MSDKTLIDKYGELAFVKGTDFLTEKHQVVSISPALDIITGGVPGGSYVILTGDPKCGKTVTSLHLAGNAQKQGRHVFYLNIEGRLKTRDIQGIKHLDPDKVTVVRSYRDEKTGETKILTAEQFIEIAEHYIHTVPGCVLIMDSVSMLLTDKEQTGDAEDQHRAPGARLMANFLKRMSNVVPVNDNIVICIQHLIANTSGYGKSKVRSGGRKIAYAVDIDLEAKKVEFLRKDADSPPYGQKVTWITGSTSASLPPGQTIESTIRYGVGIDEATEIIEMGVATGFINKGGAWYTLSYMKNHVPETEWNEKDYKYQGFEKLYNALSENPSLFDPLKEDMMRMLRG